MKLLLGSFCFTLLLAACSCIPTNSKNSTDVPIHMAYTCMSIHSGKEVNKNPILLLHGIFGFKETWLGLMQVLAIKTGRRVCAADLRNHGDSPWTDEFNTHLLALDVELLLKTLKIDKVVILGHSTGGKTAAHFTLLFPDKVEKLIVEDMRPNSFADEKILFKLGFDIFADKALEQIPKGANEAEARKAVVNYLKGVVESLGEAWKMDEIIAEHYPIKCVDGKCSWKANMEVLGRVKYDIFKHFPKSEGIFGGPALFIYGSVSPIKVGEVKEEIFELFPNATMVEVPGAGHSVSPFPQFREAVLKFIES